jgi:hypothetical protein
MGSPTNSSYNFVILKIIRILKRKMYKIYHIPGIKIGCTTQPIDRVNEQGYYNFEIIEEHTDIYVASDREQELQREYGYRVDECPYWKSYQQNIERRSKLTKEKLVKAGKESGNKNVESGWIKEFQKRSVMARTGTKHSEESKMKMRLARLGKPSPKKGKKYKV